jgi:nicotine blue oxidoreductase
VVKSGGHKLLADFRGKPLVSWALSSAVEADLGVTLAVTGAVDLGVALPDHVVAIHNPDWASGLATSLHCAISVARELELAAIVVGLGDQPLVTAAAWRAVAASDAPIAVATYGASGTQGRARRNAVKLARSVWDELPRWGDEGARALMRARPELVAEVPCEGDPVDIDTTQDLAARL